MSQTPLDTESTDFKSVLGSVSVTLPCKSVLNNTGMCVPAETRVETFPRANFILRHQFLGLVGQKFRTSPLFCLDPLYSLVFCSVTLYSRV